MKKIKIVANWKCNPGTLKEAKVLFNLLTSELKKNFSILKDVETIVCPPFLYLPFFVFQVKNLKHYNLKFGAQNCFWEEKGPFTGEVSPLMLKNLGCQYVILGHSERRQILKETELMIGKKIKTALKAKLKPILCIGESLEEKKKKKTFQVLRRQLKIVFPEISKVIIAYEPIWAIGTAMPCPPGEAQKILFFLKKFSEKSKILYGGSVNSQNCKEYIKVGFDGLLVGSASLIPKEFVQILKNATNEI